MTPREALAHPTWDMGVVVTTNSATLVNKGLEVIEAHLLFGVPYDAIEVTVHPQSIVHSMVEFADGSTIAQASPPDMRLPISLGLGWPDRVPGVGTPLDWATASSWTFEPLDEKAFPAVALAKRVGEAGLTYPAVFNAANEEAVTAFHAGRIGFLDILNTVERVVDAHEALPLTLEHVLEAERWARAEARAHLSPSRLFLRRCRCRSRCHCRYPDRCCHRLPVAVAGPILRRPTGSFSISSGARGRISVMVASLGDCRNGTTVTASHAALTSSASTATSSTATSQRVRARPGRDARRTRARRVVMGELTGRQGGEPHGGGVSDRR